MNYYNEFDPKAAAWLRQLIADKLIPAGDVDERSIVDVRPSELDGYTQCHFFAGIGGWSLALERAGWPADRPVWTGSCPCQPFSVAGRGGGSSDARHLWPDFARLIRECQPSVVFGEQVASKLGRLWLSAVQADLEALAYAVGAADLCAAGVGAPHIRQRLWWVADAERERRQLQPLRESTASECRVSESGELGEQFGSLGAGGGGMADAASARYTSSGAGGKRAGRIPIQFAEYGVDRVGHPQHSGPQRHRRHEPVDDAAGRQTPQRYGPTSSVWSDVEWLPCLDHKTRPIESGLSPLVDVLPRGVVPSGDPSDPRHANATSEGRVMRLRGYGNAIVPEVAAVFIRSYREARA